MCGICQVPLCRTPIGTSTGASCYYRFHHYVNLQSEQKQVRDLLIASQSDNSEKAVHRREMAKRARNSNGGNDDHDKDGEGSMGDNDDRDKDDEGDGDMTVSEMAEV